MNQSLKIFSLLVAIIVTGSISSVQAQQEIPISDEGTINDVSCGSPIVITDSNADDGNYAPNESFVITICIEDASETFAEVTISPELFGDVWDIDEESNLFIYDGASTAAPLIGAFNSVSHPAGVSYTGTGLCLTLEFVSGANSSGEGFTATFSCIEPLQPFNFSFNSVPELQQFDDLPFQSIHICFGDSIILNTITSYPLSDAGGNGYEQSDETSLFTYTMGDGTIYQGLGLTQISHTYEDPFGYQVTVQITDVLGQVEVRELFVLIAPRPNFTNLVVQDSLCIGEETVITGGILDNDTVGVEPNSSAILGGGILGEQLFLPDGNDDNYETVITIDDFPDGLEITSLNDFVNFCVTMEHSFLGDLEMMLTCPNGTSINIFNANTGDGLFPGGFGGGSTFLGQPLDNGGDGGIPGIGYSYCFFDDSEFGTFAEEFDQNTVEVTDPTPGTSILPGTYQPEESFENFIGCPINGDWTLTVRDNLFIDDGFIFNWSIFFNPDIDPNTIFYSPDIVDVFWSDNPDIIANEGTQITVQPSAPGNNSFVFNAIDEFGCEHDTTINVYVRPLVEIDDQIACDLTGTLVPEDQLGGSVQTGSYAVINAPTSTANITFNELGGTAVEALANEFGVYIVEFTEGFCGYQDTAEIDYRPDPQVAPLPEDTVLCVGASIVLDAGPQESNSENFNVFWTRDGSVIAQDVYDVEANETGQYIVEISGVCGNASDTTNIIAITLDFEAQTVCGLQASGNAVVQPPGPGSWSSTTEGMSFSAVNQVVTAITAPDFGIIPITYTDARCPDDGLTKDFIFVEQPVVSIAPQNPDFCIDLEDLLLEARITGSSNGFFDWTVNGDLQNNGRNDTIIFPAPERPEVNELDLFAPLELFTVQVSANDFYGVCPTATDEINFVGKWCTYNVPNVITPNGDGQNDFFHVEFIEFFPQTSLRIYDRWGRLVFEEPNYDQYQASRNTGSVRGGWDPSDENAGTYFYELLIPAVDKVETGEIQILNGESDQ
jgi:gliding motility-associated-like protein